MQADKINGFVGFTSLGLHKFHVSEYAAVGEGEILILRFARTLTQMEQIYDNCYN